MKTNKNNLQNLKYIFVLLLCIIFTEVNAQPECTTTSQPVASVVQAQSVVNANQTGNFNLINDGVATADAGVSMNSTNHHIVLDLGQVYSPDTEITLDFWGNGTQTRTVVNSETPTGVYLPSGGTNPVTTPVNIVGSGQYIYTLQNATQYIQIDMTVRTGGRTEWTEATLTLSCTESIQQQNFPGTELGYAIVGNVGNTSDSDVGFGHSLYTEPNYAEQGYAITHSADGETRLFADASQAISFDLGLNQGVLRFDSYGLRVKDQFKLHAHDAKITGTLEVDNVKITGAVDNGIIFRDPAAPSFEAGRIGTLNGNTFFRIPAIPATYATPTPSFSIYPNANSPIPLFQVKQLTNLAGANTQDISNYYAFFNKNNLITAKGILNIDSYLHVGASSGTGIEANPAVPILIDGAVAHFDGRVYISEDDNKYTNDDDTEKGLDSTNEAYNDHLLWVEKGIVTTNTAYLQVPQWHDYVFNEDYNLNTIEELKTFIKENGHLPTMPSEASILENGFDAVNMTGRLVKTVEELTLHTIAQEEENTKQLQEIKVLKDDLKTQKQLSKELLKRLEVLERMIKDSSKN
ncbi:hypothetical protein KORDIASMS9_02927 [Kordia sp. SMS9]|uniref:hypothetical protein n=1 Tax=Kordia sp. SMS9 TaxID=2282170 RepID=UPI000E0DD1CC|nr:hypothetical protein [Kordia sp. SMS9]AXG70681.1 hypothetical protein KORDIASMS9_02927 [Kordia sp. SMS9]